MWRGKFSMLGIGSWPLGLLLAAFGLTGCSDGLTDLNDGVPPPGVTNETEAMQYLAAQDEFVANTEETFSDDATESDEFIITTRLNGDPIIPVSWGRFMDQISTTYSPRIESGDSTAMVQVDKDIVGTFRILAKYNENDTTTFLVEKPFTDHSTRNVIFRRVGRETRRFWLNWMPVATSMVAGKTANPPLDQEIQITEIKFAKGDDDTITVTDPATAFFRYGWRDLGQVGRATENVPELTFGQQFNVRATIVSASADTDLVGLRFGFSPVAHTRKPMTFVSQTDNGDGTFTRVYEITTDIRHHPGFFHAGVVAVTRKTLFDNASENYSVNWWGVPYRVL